MPDSQIILASLPAVLTLRQAKNLMVSNNVAEDQYKLVSAMLIKTGQELQDCLYKPEFVANIVALSNSADACAEHLKRMLKLVTIVQNRYTLMCRELLKIQQEASDHE